MSGQCDDSSLGGAAPVPVGTDPKCVGGYPGVFDMTGSVFELEDSCNSLDAGATANCVSRGGGYASARNSAMCSTAFAVGRNYTANDTGFRCCSNP